MDAQSSNGGRLNKGCRAVIKALEQTQKLCTAHEIHAYLKGLATEGAPGQTTIYRAIDSLLQIGMIQAVDLGDGEKRYERVEPGEHHHHLVCTKCLNSVHLDQCFVDSLKAGVNEIHGFEVRSHVLEIFGLCPDCKSPGPFRR